MEHKQLTEYFKTCTHADQERILSGLLAIMGQRLDPDLNSIQKDLLKEQGITCPHCQSAKIVANGKRNSVQRYWCRACNKHFRETTGTPLAWLKKKDKWLPYLRCMLSGYSLRKSAKETGISLQTSFDWRHKVLQAFKTISPEGFTGISESDDIFFLESEKGNRNLDRKARRRGGKASKAGISNEQVAVIASCDRSGHKDFQVVGKGRISK
ncbi:MAG: IS1595 family transposase, partial [Candidatus Marinimicrobia bacterium]|nr:IS1595 family transposase [Candidatus Neomarinimicrobiota bacterium]